MVVFAIPVQLILISGPCHQSHSVNSQKNGVLLFGISFFAVEILTFLYYHVIGFATKMAKY